MSASLSAFLRRGLTPARYFGASARAHNGNNSTGSEAEPDEPSEVSALDLSDSNAAEPQYPPGKSIIA